MVTHEVLSDVARRVRVQPFALSKCAVVSLTQPQAKAGDDVFRTQQVHRMRQLMHQDVLVVIPVKAQDKP